MKTAFGLFYLVVHRRKKVLVRMLTIYQVLDTMLSFSRLFKWRHLEEQLWIGVSYWLKIIDSQFLRPGSWMKATFGISIGHKRNTNLSTSLMASFFCACQKPIALFLVCCFHSQGNCTGFPFSSVHRRPFPRLGTQWGACFICKAIMATQIVWNWGNYHRIGHRPLH